MTTGGDDLQQRVLDFIAQPTSATVAFEALALEVFAFQFERNAVYRAFCEKQQRLPTSIRHWEEIPAVPTSAFKDFALTCFPVDEATAEFHTSGTTAAQSGKHYFRTLALYEAAIQPNFAAHLLPDGARLAMLVLTPSPAEAPHSSLSHMMGAVMRAFGAASSAFYVSRGTLMLDDLIKRLGEAQRNGESVFLLGTAFSFVHLFDALSELKLKFALPNGSRAMETGGFKGRSREMPRRDLYALFKTLLNIPPTHVVNEYGMTELSTQFYDETLRVQRASEMKQPPHWSRVAVIDPRTGQEAARNERGLIRVYDLANLWSIMCVQTEDMGIAHTNGFEVLGRTAGAEVRGCSLSAETFSR